MANVTMSPNPKRIRVFMGGDGKIYEGGIEQNLGNKTNANLGATGGTNKIQEGDGEEKTNKNK